MSRRPPPRPPAAPPASIEEGAARVTDYTVKLHDRQDGQGVNWRLLTLTLFKAAFDQLDKLPDDQRRAVALRVHERAYEAATGGTGEKAAAGEQPGLGSIPAPSNAAAFKSTAPHPPRVGR